MGCLKVGCLRKALARSLGANQMHFIKDKLLSMHVLPHSEFLLAYRLSTPHLAQTCLHCLRVAASASSRRVVNLGKEVKTERRIFWNSERRRRHFFLVKAHICRCHPLANKAYRDCKTCFSRHLTSLPPLTNQFLGRIRHNCSQYDVVVQRSGT